MNPLRKIGRARSCRENLELIDYDYLPKLSEKDAEWLAEFTDQHYRGKGSRRDKRRVDCLNLSGQVDLDSVPQPSTSLTPEDAAILKQEISNAVPHPPTKKCRSK